MRELISPLFPSVIMVSVSDCMRRLWMFIVCNWSVTPGVDTAQTTCCIYTWTYSKLTASLTFLGASISFVILSHIIYLLCYRSPHFVRISILKIMIVSQSVIVVHVPRTLGSKEFNESAPLPKTVKCCQIMLQCSEL